MKDGPPYSNTVTILQSSLPPPPVGIVFGLFLRFHANAPLRSIRSVLRGTSRNDERDLDAITFNDISLFSFLCIYISRRPRCFMEWRTLFPLRHFFPLERLIFQRRQVRCTKITGKNGGKIGGSCLETNTVNSVRSLWSNGIVKRMAIMAYSTSREFPLGRKEPRYPSWIINKFVFHQYYESWQIVYKYDKFFQIFIFPIFYERRIIVLVVYNTNDSPPRVNWLKRLLC